MKLAEAVALELVNLGIKYVFGAPGTTELPLVQAIAKSKHIKYIFAAHDTIAVGMADGYSRITNRSSVVNLHSAQGTLNAAGFIRVAYRDKVPVLILVGHPTLDYAIHEPNHFHENLSGVLRPLVKWLWTASSPEDAIIAIRRAWTISMSPPMGPTCVFIPQNFWSGGVGSILETELGKPSSSWPPLAYPSPSEIEKSTKIIKHAQYPVIFVGNGFRAFAKSKIIEELSDTLNAPIIFESLDRGPQIQGVYCQTKHPLCAGFYDSRVPEVISLVKNADLVIFIGCKAVYPKVIGMLTHAQQVIQIDDDPNVAGKYQHTNLFIMGHMPYTIAGIINNMKLLRSREERNLKCLDHRCHLSKKDNAIDAVNNVKKAWNVIGKRNSIKGDILPRKLISILADELPEDCLIVDDSQCTGYYLKSCYGSLRPGNLIGSMASHIGWALPVSLGVKLALPMNNVIALVGDGSLLFSLQSIATAARYKIPIIVLLANNGGYMSLKLDRLNDMKNEKEFEDILSLRSAKIDFSSFAKAFGLDGYCVIKSKEIRNTIRSAFLSSKGSIIDVKLSDDPSDWEDSWRSADKSEIK